MSKVWNYPYQGNHISISDKNMFHNPSKLSRLDSFTSRQNSWLPQLVSIYKLECHSKISLVLDRIENIVANGERADCEYFLLFPFFFFKSHFCWGH